MQRRRKLLAALLAGAAAYTPTHLRGVLTVAKAQLVEQQREELLDRQEGIGSLLEYGKPFAYYYRILEKQRRRRLLRVGHRRQACAPPCRPVGGARGVVPSTRSAQMWKAAA